MLINIILILYQYYINIRLILYWYYIDITPTLYRFIFRPCLRLLSSNPEPLLSVQDFTRGSFSPIISGPWEVLRSSKWRAEKNGRKRLENSMGNGWNWWNAPAMLEKKLRWWMKHSLFSQIPPSVAQYSYELGAMELFTTQLAYWIQVIRLLLSVNKSQKSSKLGPNLATELEPCQKRDLISAAASSLTETSSSATPRHDAPQIGKK
jgi:hypothetical protein